MQFDYDLFVIGAGSGGVRAARVSAAEMSWPQVDLESIASAGRCRILLESPGLFQDGWCLPGCADGGRWRLGDVSGRLVCAAVSRQLVVSGFDIARGRPKRAERAVPVGAVYWIDELDATPEALTALVDRGLWPDTGAEPSRRARRAEGFNRFAFGHFCD